jgi:hypothetical protein
MPSRSAFRTRCRLMMAAAGVATLLQLAGRPDFGTTAAAMAGEPPADSTWTLVFRVWTKPAGEDVVAHYPARTVTLPDGGQATTPAWESRLHVRESLVAVVENIRLRADGTFTIEACDFGSWDQEVEFQSPGNTTKKSHGDVLLRGTGKWRPEDDSISLRLEWSVGDSGALSEWRDPPPGGKQTTRCRAAADKSSALLSMDITGLPDAQLIRMPLVYEVSQWTLKLDDDSVDEASRRRAGPAQVMFASFQAPAAEKCDDEREARRDERRTTLARCENAVRYPARECVELVRREKKADVGVVIAGGETGQAAPGSSGPIRVAVTNSGPCDAKVELTIDITAGYTGDELGFSTVRPTALTEGADVDVKIRSNFQNYAFTYHLTVPPGANKIVRIEATDASRSGQTKPYKIVASASVDGDLPDPNRANNVTHRDIYFYPPGTAPPAPKK